MKKLDKLVLRSFLGPFVLTTLVVVFILLMQTMMKYFEEFVGKNLDFQVFAELFFYFAVSLTPMALPLAVLLSSLMTFGNLGEHFELTAIKSAGISLLRVLRPIFVFVVILTGVACYSNMYLVPKANLKAYRLLFDIKQTEPAMNIKEGAFYSGLKGYSIKVKKKEKDGLLRGMLIYDHSKGNGNSNVIMADSGRMYTFNNDRYMRLELFNGTRYSQEKAPNKNKPDQYVRYNFDKTEMVFSMASFDMKETDESHFERHRFMRTHHQLTQDVDSIFQDFVDVKVSGYGNVVRYHSYHLKNTELMPGEWETLQANYRRQKQLKDSLARAKKTEERLLANKDSLKVNDTEQEADPESFKKAIDKGKLALAQKASLRKSKTPDKKPVKKEKVEEKPVQETLEERWSAWEEEEIAKIDKRFEDLNFNERAVRKAVDATKYVTGSLKVRANKELRLSREENTFATEAHKRIALAGACLVMFLIGAPIGSIIKKGGLGVPVLISIVLFILFYVIMTTSEKWARESIIDPMLAAWSANLILIPAGLFFLRQARKDARLLEADFYSVAFRKLKSKFFKK